MTSDDAGSFGQRWINAWNSHDLDRILDHYADDIEVTSPIAEALLGPGHATVRGKAALRSYWGLALEKFPDLRFSLCFAFAGAGSVVLQYRSVLGLPAAECMELDDAGKVRRVLAHYDSGGLRAEPVERQRSMRISRPSSSRTA